MATKDLGLVQAISYGSSPPANTAMLWYDTTNTVIKYYDTGTTSWLALFETDYGFATVGGQNTYMFDGSSALPNLINKTVYKVEYDGNRLYDTVTPKGWTWNKSTGALVLTMTTVDNNIEVHIYFR